MSESLDNLFNNGNAKILVYKKNINHNLLSEIKSRFPNEFKKFSIILNKFNETGLIRDNEKFRRISDNFYEFKVNKLRVFCVKLDGFKPIAIVIYHYYKKQSQKMPKNEKSKAETLAKSIIEKVKNGQLKF